MKRAVFLFVAILAVMYCSIGYCVTATLTDISKLYIEYENGEHQVIDFSDNPVDYAFDLNDGVTQETGQLTVLVNCELGQNSKIAKIALWCGQFDMGPFGTFDINGYFGFDYNFPDPEHVITGYPSVPISSWVEGFLCLDKWEESVITSGVFNLNASISFDPDADSKITVTNNSAVEAANMSVTIKFAEAAYLFGGLLDTQDI